MSDQKPSSRYQGDPNPSPSSRYQGGSRTRPLNSAAVADPGTGAFGTYDGQPIVHGPVTPPRLHVTPGGTPYHVYQNADQTWGAQYAGDDPDADPSSYNHSDRGVLTAMLNHYDFARHGF